MSARWGFRLVLTSAQFVDFRPNTLAFLMTFSFSRVVLRCRCACREAHLHEFCNGSCFAGKVDSILDNPGCQYLARRLFLLPWRRFERLKRSGTLFFRSHTLCKSFSHCSGSPEHCKNRLEHLF